MKIEEVFIETFCSSFTKTRELTLNFNLYSRNYFQKKKYFFFLNLKKCIEKSLKINDLYQFY